MNFLKITFGVLIALSASRLIPHPPNFTSLIAISFYVPAILGQRYIIALLISFLITDLIIGMHDLIFFTWGSVIVIGLISKYFVKNIYIRLIGAMSGALIFFILTNFGVWTTGFYGFTINGLILCFILAIPFFTNTVLSTVFFSILIELTWAIMMKRNIKKI